MLHDGNAGVELVLTVWRPQRYLEDHFHGGNQELNGGEHHEEYSAAESVCILHVQVKR